jgi:hypothetical protein
MNRFIIIVIARASQLIVIASPLELTLLISVLLIILILQPIILIPIIIVPAVGFLSILTIN